MAHRTVLSRAELALADWIADSRNGLSSLAANVPAHGAPENVGSEPLRLNVVGARGEIAVARLLGLFPNLSTYHEEKRTHAGHDLAQRVCVRSAVKRYGLLVRPTDDPGGRYVAVVVQEAVVVVLGWRTGEEAMLEKYLRAPNGRPPCYLVPERELRPIAELDVVLAGERLRAALHDEPLTASA